MWRMRQVTVVSDKPSKQSVHGLKYHLEKVHKELYASYAEALNSCRCQAEEPPAKRMRSDEISDASSFVQLSIPSCNKLSSKWPADHLVVERIDKAVMGCIIVDMLPYSIVSGDAFKGLNFADPAGVRCYQLKSEKIFQNISDASNV